MLNGIKNGVSANNSLYLFDDFEVDSVNRTCTRSGEPVPMTGKVFDVLLTFLDSPGRLLSKEELLDRVWADEFVEEGNLARSVSTLRGSLGDSGRKHKYILTVQGRGYRFIGELKQPTILAGTIELRRPRSRRWVLLTCLCIVPVFIAFGFVVSKYSTVGGRDLFSRPLIFHRLTTSGHVTKLALSPDGNLIAFASDDRNGSSLFVRQTGVSNEVTLASVKGQIASISFSPDSKLVYYSVFRGDISEGELFSVPVLGGVSRAYPGLPVIDFSFAPDGHHFAGVNTSRDKGEAVLVVADTAGDSERELTRRTSPSAFDAGDKKVAWSPNGASIAVVVNEKNAEVQYSSLLLIDPRSGAEDPFTTFQWNQINSVQWISDSSGLVVVGSAGQGETDQLYFVSMEGSVSRLTNDDSTYSLVAANAHNRSMIAIKSSRTSSLWSHSPGPLPSTTELTSGSGILAPITFLAGQIVYRTSGIGGSDLWTVSIDGNGKHPLTQDAKVDSRGLCSTPNGKIVFSSRKSGKNNLWRFDPADSSMQQITFGENEIFPACSPDGNWVVFQRMASSNQKTSLWKVNINGGEPESVTDYLAVRPAISPDGKWIAVFYMDDPRWKVGLIPFAGGEIEKSYDLPEGMGDRIARWSIDGRSLLLVGNYGEVGNIWRLPFDGSAARKITDLDQQNIEDLSVSPTDGTLFLSRSTTISDVYISTGEE